MINPHSVNEARVTLRRALAEPRLLAVSETLQSPQSKLERGLGSWVGPGGFVAAHKPQSHSQDVPCQGPPPRVEEATRKL